MDQGFATVLAALISAASTIAVALIASRPRRHDIFQLAEPRKSTDLPPAARASDASGSPFAASTATRNGLAVPVLSAVIGGAAILAVALAIAAVAAHRDAVLWAGLALSGFSGLGILYVLVRLKHRDGAPGIAIEAVHELIAGLGSMAVFILLAWLAWKLGLFDGIVRVTPTDILRS
jgi:hypothetical protein